MNSAVIRKESMDFLKRLSRNNNRDWFNKHKDEYLEARENIIAFANALLSEMSRHDQIETPSGKDALFRIYRDIRFSKIKTPYNTHWNGGFRRATKKLRGGYYFELKPGASFLGGGFWGPEPADLRRIRQDIDLNHADWKKLLGSKSFTRTFGKVTGEEVGTAPRGYDKNHPAIDLLRLKQYVVKIEFSDEDVVSPGFVKKMSEGFRKMRPFLDYVSEVLTTDANGVPLI